MPDDTGAPTEKATPLPATPPPPLAVGAEPPAQVSPIPSGLPPGVFPGYEILGTLGSGGMGIVYRTRDLRRNQFVALKTMQRFDPGLLYRFKQEFRTLADLVHPNLVALYDLVAEGDRWFFTMEYVKGATFLEYLRRAGETAAGETILTAPPNQPAAPVGAAVAGCLSPEKVQRLRHALRQLAEGVSFLHSASKLHRDIKPSNVLVTPTGRVVLLDFGLTADVDRSGLHQSSEEHVVGTAAYMAPEQAAGRPVSPAADWYSVGVLLYEALTGRLPFEGRSVEVLLEKQQHEPPAPREVVPGVPDDLNALCVDLLRRDPVRRPTGQEVLARLGEEPSQPPAGPPAAPATRVPLVGRRRHLTALADAFATVTRGQTVVVYVHGHSGMGKSALVQHFLDGMSQRQAAVVLAGRCYEQESVPFKALDSLVDALSRYWRRLPDPEAQALLPRDIQALARVFPVLRQVGAVAAAPPRGADIPDQQELRRRAFAALREFLARLGDRRALVLCIDDLQWGDVDSAKLLLELVRPPDPPLLLLLCSYRSEDVNRSKCLQALLQAAPADAPGIRRDLAVEALTPADARELAAVLLGEGSPGHRGQADAIGEESGGSPLFVYELVRAVQTNGGEAASRSTSVKALDEVLWERIRRLPEAPRRILEVTAVAGGPLRQADARRAVDAGPEARFSLSALHGARLIRSTGLEDQDEIETYHDRIRETVVAHLDPAARQAHHAHLARALEDFGRAEPEVLARHFHSAGEFTRAGDYYRQAASRAAETLAFVRAAELCRLALQLCPAGAAEVLRLRTQLADALANAGRGGEAGHEYLSAAAGAAPEEALELRRRAALQLLISGHVDEGLAALRLVLGGAGLKLAPNPRRALLALLLHRAQLWFRGLKFRERDASQVPLADLRQVDICSSVAVGLGMIDPIRGADFQSRSLLLALRAGEPYRIARALALQAVSGATAGTRAARRTSKLLDSAAALAEKVGNPHALGLVSLSRGVVAYLEGRWADSRMFLEGAERTFRDRCIGVAWELDTAQLFYLFSLCHLGELANLSRRLPLVRKEAAERGDLYTLTWLELFLTPVIRMASDDAEGARRDLSQQMGRLPQQGFHLQQTNGLFRAAEVELYAGDGNAARRLAAELWSAQTGSLLTRVQFLRTCTCQLLARSALAAAITGTDATRLLATAERQADRLEGEERPDALAWAKLFRAGIAAARGHASRATILLGEAVAGLDAVGMRLYAAAARRRLGRLIGGDAGKALVAEADAWMASQGIKNPARMTAMLAPGFPDG
jgi:hypothetical protein